ncbi:hypothetical protein DMA12_18300 [Amycolatopsis balhimycina DSM 5908]|uniref:Uncharacterized protein n=1 Tax=Amycolatopsis balhimycina DSM 5908 TaxID=1081091 RepID=A0A428WLB1_AMYBA|nr:hypothetical protein DMA12_18300 [Amycolatopsis balhimycina DSM 5908]
MVPAPAVTFRLPNASTEDAFSSAIVAYSAEPEQLAAKLVHEFHHIRLGGVQHLATLHATTAGNGCTHRGGKPRGPSTVCYTGSTRSSGSLRSGGRCPLRSRPMNWQPSSSRCGVPRSGERCARCTTTKASLPPDADSSTESRPNWHRGRRNRYPPDRRLGLRQPRSTTTRPCASATSARMRGRSRSSPTPGAAGSHRPSSAGCPNQACRLLARTAAGSTPGPT